MRSHTLLTPHLHYFYASPYQPDIFNNPRLFKSVSLERFQNGLYCFKFLNIICVLYSNMSAHTALTNFLISSVVNQINFKTICFCRPAVLRNLILGCVLKPPPLPPKRNHGCGPYLVTRSLPPALPTRRSPEWSSLNFLFIY